MCTPLGTGRPSLTLVAALMLAACSDVAKQEAAENAARAPVGGGSSVGGADGSTLVSGSGGVSGSSNDASAGPTDAPPGATPYDGSVITGAPIGWASVNADSQDGTYGGRDGPALEVTTREQLEREAADSLPRIVRISGTISAPRKVEIGSNKTLIGAPGAVFHGQLSISGQKNVIVQNLTIRGNDCFGSTDNCDMPDDAITVSNSHHIWLDHLDIADGSDGNVDITNASSYVTVSWTKFWYSRGDRPHRFSNLIGADDNVPTDVGRLNVTFHHDWWADNVNQRMPRTRAGQIHVFNNLFTSTGSSYCTEAGQGASLLVENNIYRGVHSPHKVDSTGNLLARDNVYDEGTDGDQESTGVAFTPPYAYTAESTDALADAVMTQVGPH